MTGGWLLSDLDCNAITLVITPQPNSHVTIHTNKQIKIYTLLDPKITQNTPNPKCSQLTPTADSRSIFIYPPTPQQFHEKDQKKYKKMKILRER
jgi:hypothetical protein